jgi:pimeloyl-ACP methyl ester carboxylesterase
VRDGSLLVSGYEVRYRRLGRPGAPTLLLLHGGRAHSGWWTAVAPLFADRFDVLVPDLTGHGDSGHRPHYTPGDWAAELAELVAHTGTSPVTVVGHSMGGRVAIFLAGRYPDLVSRLVLVDTPLRPPGSPPRSTMPRRKRSYPDKESALVRFRLDPPQTAARPDLLRRVGEHGLTPVTGGGWTWKFDPQASRRITDEAMHDELPTVRCPIGTVDGALSTLVGPGTTAYLASRLGRGVPRVTVDGAYHHVPLDNPAGCAAAITAMLTTLSQ